MWQQNMGLLFWRALGNGKTFITACIANELMKQEKLFPATISMTTFGTILNKLSALLDGDKEHYLNNFKSCDLLILDDFGMERQKDYVREQVFGVIDARYLAQKPLIVTSQICS